MLGPTNIFLIAIAGICLFGAATQLMASWSALKREPIRPLFGVLCLLTALYAGSRVWNNQALDLDEFYASALWQDTFLRLFTILIPWFFAYYARWKPGPWVWLLSIGFLPPLVLELVTPGSLFYDLPQILVFKPALFGEIMPVISARVSFWGYWMYAFYLGIIVYGISVAVHLFRNGQKSRSWGMSLALAVSIGIFVHDFLVDIEFLPYRMFLVEFAFFTFVILIGLDLNSLRIKAAENYRVLFHSVSDAIFVHDAETGRFLDANEAASRMFGASPEELIRCGFLRMLSGIGSSTAENATRAVQLATRENAPVSEWLARRLDNDVQFWVETSLRQETIDGRTVILASVRNIDERKKAEEEKRRFEERLRETQRLESLGVLAGGVAHDFNNLLTTILGNTDLAARALHTASPAHAHLEGVKNSCHRAADLCRQLLGYSGRGRFVLGAVDIQGVVEDMMRILDVSIPSHVRRTLDYGKDVPSVTADATQMRQVIMNLVTNAVEAIGADGGDLRISTGSERLTREGLSNLRAADHESEGLYAYLEVSDTGVGMDAETQAHLFEPFFSSKALGRGLGMAAVLGIVRGHRGAIRVTSVPGQGSSIRVYFPAGKNASAPAPAEPTASPASTRSDREFRVLVVDDDEDIRISSCKALEAIGYAPENADGGRKAVERLASGGPAIDVVLLDLTMPDWDGRRTQEEIHKVSPGMKIVLVSGHNPSEAKQGFREGDIASVLQKPFTFDELQAVLKKALEGN